MESDRQVAAKCVARLFQGIGHEIRKSGSGIGYGEEGADRFTDFEKRLLKEAFDFFLDLIKGEKSE